MKKLLLIFILSIFVMPEIQATHLIGGEITWECIASGANKGRFIFTVKKYRTCKVGVATGVGVPQINNPFGGNIATSWVSQGDIAPGCYSPILELDCFGGTAAKQNDAIEEFVYQSAPVTIAGTPATGGSVFWVSDCCRPSGITNSSSTGSFIWRAVMYPYTTPTGTLSLGTFAKPDCYDSSPQFAERPAAIICTDYLFTYNHNATDPDQDSLDYKWAASWTGSVNSSINYTSGFSAINPLPNPGNPSNANNVAATVNPTTGEVSFLSYDAGRYYTNIQVDAYKCGQLVASIFREIPVNLLNCAPLPAPFPPGTFNNPPNVSLTYKTISQSNLNISVLAGEVVEFELQSTDFEFLPGFVQQSNTLEPSGFQFGANFADTMLCPYPPCAVLDTNSSGPPTGYYNPSNQAWEGVTGLRTDFYWETDCNHLARSITANGFSNCFTRSNVYTFVFKVLDDYCPAPGATFVTASITVNAPDPLDPPTLKCVSVLPGGDVDLSWNIPVTLANDSNNSFRSYVIFRSHKRDTTYQAVDTITNIMTSSYTDVGANAHTRKLYYFIMGVSSCNGAAQQVFGDTITTLTLDAVSAAGGDSVYLNWPHFVQGGSFPATTIQSYNVYEIYQNDTTLISTQTGNSYADKVTTCAGGSKCFPSNVSYFITVEDTTLGWSCMSRSNTEDLVVGDNTAPDPPVIQLVSVDAGGFAQITWTASTDCDVEKYYIYENGVIVDSVGANVTSYNRVFTSGTAIGHAPLTYSISAIDSCGKLGNASFAHTSMQAAIDGSGVIRCFTSKQVPVVLSPYAGETIAKYILFADTGTGPFAVDSVDPTGVTFPYTFVDTSVRSAFYTYTIRGYTLAGGLITESSTDTITMNTINGDIMPAPALLCSREEENGDVSIVWDLPVNTGNNHDAYIIYHSTDGTNFTPLDTIEGTTKSDNSAYTRDTFLHVGAGGGAHFYQMYSRSGCFGTDLSPTPSNTIRTLNLDVTQVGSSINEVKWDFIPTPTSQQAIIFREYPVGTGLAQLKTVPNTTTTHLDTISICDDIARFRIEIGDATLRCSSYTTIDTGVYKDNTPPAKQFLDSVSVNDNNNAILGWSENPSPDVVRYFVIRDQGAGAYEIIDTVDGTTRSYVDFNHLDCVALIAEDSCGNVSFDPANFDFHCPIRPSVSVDRCDQSFLVQWNPYKTFVTGEEVVYDVFVSENGLGFEKLGSTPDNNFRFKEPISGNNYCFYVRATEDEGNGPATSTSDTTCVSSEFLVKPAYSYLRTATVEDSNEIRITAWVDIRADVSEYLIQRGLDTNNMKTIATIQVPKILTQADSTIEYIDRTPRTSLKSYYYRVATIDPCGDPIAETNAGRSILLKVKANNESKSNILNWSNYTTWAGDVQSYKIYRDVQGGGNPQFLRTVDGDVTTFTDDVSLLTEESEGRFCYYVEANEGTPYFPGLNEPAISRSNQVCVIQYPLFFIPTAFTPGESNSPGLNDVFKPEGVFVDLENYSFEIFNRWGERIYSTDDFKTGWDGTISGKPAQAGAYVYIIKYKGADGSEYQQEGTVSITR